MDEPGKAVDRDNVFSLSEARAMKRANEGKPELTMKPGTIWYCVGCGGDKFRLYVDKTIHCSTCHCFIKNLAVEPS